MANNQLHPIVYDSIYTSKSLKETLEDYKDTKDPIIEGMIQLHQALFSHDSELKKKVVQETERISIKNVDTYLAILFLRSRIVLLNDFNNLYKSKEVALAKHTLNLLNKSTLPDLKSIIEYNLSSLEEDKNTHYDYYLSIFNKNTEHIPPGQLKQATGVVRIFAKQGLLKKVNKDLTERLSIENQRYATFTDHVERLNLSEASKELKKIKAILKKQNNSTTKATFFKYERWEFLLELFSNRFSPIANTNLLDEEHKCFINANYYLSINNIPMAAKELLNFPVKKAFESSSFLAFTNIRLALSQKNAPAAQALLNTKKKNYQHYFDDFFHMRIELLQGNKEQALLHYTNLAKHCDHYEANNLLEFELNLSQEIKPGDLWYLISNRLKIKTTKLNKLLFDQKNSIELKGIEKIVHKSKSMNLVCKKIKQFANSSSHILITGETGVGKDLVAKAIHDESTNANKPFIAINCGAISESILQSELFGHEAGAYTSAERKHVGIFESAKNGTVFLDEIGDTSLQIQVALLRVLENLEGRSVGSNRITKYTCRIIAATNIDLAQQIKMKTFREDLYFRLKILEINIPPLRERPLDIEAQMNYFFNLNQVKGNQPTLSTNLKRAFSKYSFPGNTRELKNEIQNARIINGEKEHYDLEDIPFLNVIPKEITNKTHLESHNIMNDPSPVIDELEIIRKPNQINYRREKIKLLFKKYKRLSRQEISDTLRVTYKTAGTDMKALLDEGFIKKITPTPSPRTHYFILNE